uniref:Sushi domain-containing protein n=1 Tax=Aquila chrysaetos chrysaetos TaxID=223781 RepID=A0A663F8D8_AQUCH
CASAGIPCKPPPDIPNGKHTGRLLDEFYFGTSVTYTCNRGYPLHGEPSIYCTTRDGKNGEWSGPPPQCGGRVVSGCNAPTRLVFAELKKPYSNQTVFPVGSTVEYVCQPGYAQHLGMSPAITCLRNRTWSGALEFCKMLQCPSPPNIKNGQYENKDVKVFIPGVSVKYYCDLGYVLTGKTTVSCLTSGTWSLPYPRCEGELDHLHKPQHPKWRSG